ncbi:polysaccharide pyruvyl transferase family protein [Candidatus Pelagibacter sp.]|nr:polysaccharide pyruvyl transferase family protein [Candidatus Pelagibacter sp.]
MIKYKKKRLGILAIHNVDNYGAILQSFAFYKYLNKFTNAKIINYQNPVFLSHLRLVRYNGLGTLKSCLKDLIRLNFRYRLINKFKKFIKKNLKLTKPVNLSYMFSNSFLRNFDALVVSSDQVWNPDITHFDKKLRGDYFLNINIKRKLKKFSYGSSFGSRIFDKSEIYKINSYLNNLDFISVREKSSLKFINKKNLKKTKLVIDPVFLMDNKFWKNKVTEKKNPINKKYILVYSVARSQLIKKTVRDLNKNLNLKVITIDPNLVSICEHDKKISDAGLEEFLYYYKNSSFVITDSFHGACFSLIFDKKFLAVISSKKYANRITEFLKYVNCENNIFKKNSYIKNINDYKISKNSKKKIFQFTQKSKNYLRNALKK